MNAQDITELEAWIHKHVLKGGDRVGLKKRGLWYRPSAQGYTDKQAEAGRFTREEARRHEYPKPGSSLFSIKDINFDDRVTVHEFDPEPCASDEAAAMRVLRACVDALGWHEPISVGTTAGGDFFVTYTDFKLEVSAEADTLPMAICLFAKKLFSDDKSQAQHCHDCDPSFTTCWNDGSKCRKAPKS